MEENTNSVTLTTAIVKVNPSTDPDVIKLYKEVQALLAYAIARTVTSVEDVKLATNDLSILSKLKKAIEERRKEYTQPINAHLKAVNDDFKVLTEPLLQADQITRSKVLEYRGEQERIRAEEEHINRLRIEAAQAEQKLKGEITEDIELVEESPEQAKRYRTDSGLLGTVKIKKWEVVDFAQVPDSYKMIDAGRVKKIVNAGGSIPGIRVWEEESLRVTIR